MSARKFRAVFVPGASMRSIAASLAKSPSTISREVSQNGGRRHYRAAAADGREWKRAVRPKLCKLAIEKRLRLLVSEKLSLDWSPQQIAGWLRETFRATPPCKSSMKQFIKASLFKPAAFSSENCSVTCVLVVSRVARNTRRPQDSRVDKSLTLSSSAKDQRRLKIERCLGIGKETSSAAPAIRTSSRSSNDNRALRCW